MTTIHATCSLPFCELPNDHGWDSIGIDGAVRYHSQRTGTFVEVIQEETITPDGPMQYRAQFWAPGVYVEELPEPMTADQAASLAAALLEASRLTRELDGPGTAAAFSSSREPGRAESNSSGVGVGPTHRCI